MGSADGRVIYCLPLNAEDRKWFQTLLTDHAYGKDPRTILALPTELLDIEDTCRELAALRSVRDNTPELANDAAARRELRARLAAMENLLVTQLRRVFRPGGADGPTCRWFHLGKEIALATPRSFNEFLSRVCDDVYNATPAWRNELVNRRDLSSSAAKARRNLIEAMIERTAEEALGIQGTPPERSMYESLLRSPRLHRRTGDLWGFHPPRRNSDPALVAVWEAIDTFFAASESQRTLLTELFDLLRAPPYGLKDGVLPVLLLAALLHHETEVALYEEGTFVPLLSTAVFERLLSRPQAFGVQRCRVTGPRALVFQKYQTLLLQESAPASKSKPQLLSVVRPLFKLIKHLPDYVLQTQQLSAEAKAVLQAIQTTREPDTLLFAALPRACGSAPFGHVGAKRNDIDAFFGKLRTALVELQQAYPKLEASIEQLLRDAFNLTSSLAEARIDLTHRAKLVANVTVDARLKSFVIRASDSARDNNIWLESLAALLAGKPPRMWNDQDRARYDVNLALTARLFRHLEVLAFEKEREGAALLDGDIQAMRVSFTLPNTEEVERVIRIPPNFANEAREVQGKVRSVLEATKFHRDPEISAAVLADLSRQLLTTEGPPAE
jgi:hypothetical protein